MRQGDFALASGETLETKEENMIRKLSLAAFAAVCLLPVMGDELWYEAVDESRSWDRNVIPTGMGI